MVAGVLAPGRAVQRAGDQALFPQGGVLAGEGRED